MERCAGSSDSLVLSVEGARAMRRRDFITLLGAAAWSLTASAQQKMRRIAVLMSAHENDTEQRRRLTSFVERFHHRLLGNWQNRADAEGTRSGA